MKSAFAPSSTWLGSLKNKLFADSASDSATAIYLSSAAVAIVHGTRTVDGARYAIDLRADPVETQEDYVRVLELQKASLEIKNRECHVILGPDFYNLTLVERPKVEAEELKEAVRWAAQESIDFPMELAELDMFDMPKSASRDNDKSMLFVSVARKDLIGQVANYVHDAGLTASTIGITELSFRNIVATLFPEADRSIGFLRLTPSNGLINVSRSKELFLSRRIIGMPGAYSESAWDKFKDPLLLQVQRSIDYYESAMSQPPCDAIVVATTHSWQVKVCEYLDEMLPVPIRSFTEVMGQQFDLTLHNPDPIKIDWTNFNNDYTNAISAGLPAIGGLLRGLRSDVLSDSQDSLG